jgi:hypothetical protein
VEKRFSLKARRRIMMVPAPLDLGSEDKFELIIDLSRVITLAVDKVGIGNKEGDLGTGLLPLIIPTSPLGHVGIRLRGSSSFNVRP